MDPESKKNLIILGFESDINEIPKMKIVLKMWRKRAKVCHPDKEGGMKEEFQKLQEALKKAGDIIKRMTKVDEEEICSRKVFDKFNFQKENSSSYTENKISSEWNGDWNRVFIIVLILVTKMYVKHERFSA